LIYLNKYKQFFLNFLVLTFPISFLIGKAFVETLLILISIYTLINLKNWKRYLIDKNYIIILLFLYYTTIVLSTLINIEVLSKATDQTLLLKSFSNFRFIIYIISIWYVLEEIKFNKFYFLITLTIYILFLIDGYVQFFYGQNLIGYEMLPSGRITGVFDDELIFGSYIQKVIPIILIMFFLILKTDEKYYFLLLTLLSLSSVIIIFTGDRTPIILYTFFFIISFIFLSKLRKIILLNFFVTVFFSVLIILSGSGKNINSLENRYNLKSEYNLLNLRNPVDDSSKMLKYVPRDHYGHFLVVKEMLKDNLIFGKGIRSFRVLCRGKLGNLYPIKNGVCSTHPHNYYLQSLAAGGLIAFLLLLVIFLIFTFKLIKIFLELFKNQKKNYILNLAIISFFVYLWPLTPTGNFFSNWIACFNCFALAIYLFLNSDTDDKNKLLI